MSLLSYIVILLPVKIQSQRLQQQLNNTFQQNNYIKHYQKYYPNTEYKCRTILNIAVNMLLLAGYQLTFLATSLSQRHRKL